MLDDKNRPAVESPSRDMPDQPDKPAFEISEEELAAAVSPADVRGRINLRLSKAMEAEIDDIASDTRYPFNSVSEIVRYCCLRGLRELREWKPAPTLLGSIRAANALMLRDKLQCESLELLDRLDERIQWYLRNRHYDEVIDLVARVRSYFDGTPDEFWSDRIRQEIDGKFIQWMDQMDAERRTNTEGTRDR